MHRDDAALLALRTCRSPETLPDDADDAGLQAPDAGPLRALPQAIRQAVRAAALSRFVPARSPVWKPGEVGGGWVGVVSGAIRLSMPEVGRRGVVVEIVGPGESADVEAFRFGCRGSYATHAISDARLLILPPDAYGRLMDTQIEFCRFVSSLALCRLRAAHKAMAHFAGSDLEGRVAHALLDLDNRFGVLVDDEKCIRLRVRQQDIADSVGASRQRVNAVIGQLAVRGVLRMERRHGFIWISDLQRLRHLAGRHSPRGAHVTCAREAY